MVIIPAEARIAIDAVLDLKPEAMEPALAAIREAYGITGMFIYIAKPNDNEEIKNLAKSRLCYHKSANP